MHQSQSRTLATLAAGVALCASATVLAQGNGVVQTVMATFNEPWAVEFLPDGRALVTEKSGSLKLFAGQDLVYDITGEPQVAYGGQGGLGDIALHPDFATNGIVYLSYAEAGSDNTRGAAVARARLDLTPTGGALSNLQVIWRQVPKTTGSNHYSHRIAFDADGYLWISSGERQLGAPAQQLDTNLGKIVRLHDDGSVPADNPFASMGGVAAQIWSLGHRNILGLAFDELGRLWNVEMGPQGGDELNLIERGENYGWPIVSNGRNYNSPVDDIPDHATRPEFRAPLGSTADSRVISPSSLVFYNGNEFPDWQGNAFISGLTNRTVSRIEFTSVDSLREAQRWTFPQRVRAVEQGPEGGLWLLEDGSGGRLIRYTAP
jgi:glucose/arabinose dehydrogenase